MTKTLVIVLSLIAVALAIACVIIRKIAHKKGYKAGYEARKTEAETIFGSAEAEGKRIVSEAVKEGENKKREFLLAAKEEIHKSRIDLERDIKERRNEIQRNERRLIQKEESLDKKLESLEQRDAQLNEKAAELAKSEEAIKEKLDRQITELERIAGMGREEAKACLLSTLENDLQHETVTLLKEFNGT